ncbi:MAG: radical SAM protein, partial [Lachnospiraceae bacterium]|nr:radical SAM protein [Lachnospiraceae bacterium]
LVTADIYLPEIREAIRRAKDTGFKLPFILNTSSYLSVESIRSLEGLIDIYLPDIKYIRDADALRYSNAPGYPNIAKAAVDEMVRQCPGCIFEEKEDGMMLKKGVIIRHLLMPGMLIQAKLIIKRIHDRFGDSVLLSLLNQYTPNGMLDGYPKINRRVTENEYRSLLRYAESLGVRGYMQDKESADECYIPEFDLSGV